MADATLSMGVEVDQSGRHRGGVLDNALPAPDGWQRGVQVPWYGCGAPILRDKCVTATDEPHRTSVADFGPFPIEQGATCSTLSRLDQESHALGRLNATTEWAMGRQLATDQVGLGQPSFADGTSIGVLDPAVQGVSVQAAVTAAIAALEQTAANVGYGARWVLHSSVAGAAFLANAHLTSRGAGGALLSPSGASVIVSTGYPTGAATIRYWVTGPVWAAVDAPETRSAVGYRTNDDDGWAMRAGLVAFDPCLNYYVDVVVPELTPLLPEPLIVDPVDGAVLPPIFDISGGGAIPGTPVDLYASRNPDRVLETVTADADGNFVFAGGNKAAIGTYDWWVVNMGAESDRVTVTVADLQVTSPADGSTQDPLFDVVGTGAVPGAEVSLWFDDHTGSPAATVTAEADGSYTFSGTHEANVGTRTMWTTAPGGQESPHVTVTVEDATPPTETLSFDWEARVVGGSVDLAVFVVDGALPAGTWEWTSTYPNSSWGPGGTQEFETDFTPESIIPSIGDPGVLYFTTEDIGAVGVFTMSGPWEAGFTFGADTPLPGEPGVFASGTVTYTRPVGG